MGTLDKSLNPFSKPVRPLDPMYGPDQIRGNDNQLGKALNTHLANVGVHLVTKTTTGVNAVGGTLIYPVPSGQVFAAVAGNNGAAKAFLDLIGWHPSGASVVVFNSGSTEGAPDARTYSLLGGALNLQMAAGTYTVQVIPVLFN